MVEHDASDGRMAWMLPEVKRFSLRHRARRRSARAIPNVPAAVLPDARAQAIGDVRHSGQPAPVTARQQTITLGRSSGGARPNPPPPPAAPPPRTRPPPPAPPTP